MLITVIILKYIKVEEVFKEYKKYCSKFELINNNHNNTFYI